jgi:hypothetical protein
LPIVAGLTGVDDPVTAARADSALALPARLLQLAIGATAIAADGITVIARLVRIDHVVAAQLTRLPHYRTTVVGTNLGAGAVATVTRRRVVVVAHFAGLQDPVSTDVATAATGGACPAGFLMAGAVATITVRRVVIVAGFAPEHHAVAA